MRRKGEKNLGYPHLRNFLNSVEEKILAIFLTQYTMKVKLSEVVSSEKTLDALFKKQLPTKIAYRLSRIKSKLTSELGVFFDTRNNLIKKYGAENPETKIISVTPENDEIFNKEVSELLAVEIDLPNYDKIAIEDLGEEKIEPNLLPVWLFEERNGE